MTSRLDHTHDAGARSWIASANQPDAEFPIQNLPLGVFRPRGGNERPRIGLAIGDQVLDLRRAASLGALGALDPILHDALSALTLNRLMAHGRLAARAVRHAAFAVLREGADARAEVSGCLLAMSDAEMLLPAAIGDYTDFYASIHHATNVGTMLRPDNPLLPNYKWVPIGYHGRASSIVPSGTPICRPMGQLKPDEVEAPVLGPSKSLDYECEVGAWIGTGNRLGRTIAIESAEDALFGLCLVNDWSSRDVQRWEYQPLGPFLSKNFGTTVSPWVISLDALEPFRVPAFTRAEGDPEPLPYLRSEPNRTRGGFGIDLEVWISTQRMRDQKTPAVRLSRCSFTNMYWTVAQLLTHHASNGCNLTAGDLLASGTVSGPDKSSRGCLLELTWRGKEPLELPGGETRRFLEDGDEVCLRGRASRDGFVSIGFGECRGVVVRAGQS